ncbi:MAG TPA: UDP-N-acetylmuramoyl-L-alanyl-D-glutamate--2,6-diaminopimelate ligase [Polyangia bacterium]|jgi:UDP-N-acetylmuramoyl-L-alanyl-D-glutamate--2,6-diaminopimelate ligase|nr:UDP-N-acetylmuramoyl-L-alanyl-D-glutamate--2,6-diaminopimelate ligase [Polyangia bacterium]
MNAPAFQLSALLAGVEGAVVRGGALVEDITVADVRDDSRLVQPGDLFIAVPGTATDGRAFVAAAVQRGARVVVTEGGGLLPDAGAVTMVTVANARQAQALIAANRFKDGAALDLMAVTGTNGKTTTTYLVEAMLAATGLIPGVIGTVSYRSAAAGWRGGARAASLTTPGALALHALLAEMRAAGTTDVILEASSQALDQRRLDGCRFRVAALTNVTQDHLDYHQSMDRYFDAKALLFERLLDPARGVAVFLLDGDAGRKMRRRVRGLPTLGVTVKTAAPGADIAVAEQHLSADGTRARFSTPVGSIDVASPLVGEFNLANIATAVGMGVARGLPPNAIAAGIGALPMVPGRLERVPNQRGILCVVDYAHTPDALERAIAALRPLTSKRLFVVFGCGGDRDRGKRPLMGEVAARDGDIAIVTSDNPRSEDPGSIVDMVADGARRALAPELSADELPGAFRGFTRVVDRRAAIRLGAASVQPGDVLLIAGKGHEDYQIIGTTKYPFDDRLVAAAALAARDEAGP